MDPQKDPYVGFVKKEDVGKLSLEKLEHLDRVVALCMKYDIPYQKFSNHSDIRGGGTIGSVISAMLPANAIDQPCHCERM